MKSLAILFSIFFFIIACEPQKNQRQALNGAFLFIKGKVLINDSSAKLGNKIKQADLIEVKEKSRAVLQLNNALVIQMSANSKLQISKLNFINKKNVIETTQKKGTVFHKLTPGAGSQYQVRTPTVTAGVRGTAFQLSVKKKNVELKLIAGKVSLENKDQSKTVELSKNQKVAARGNKIGKVKKLSKKEKKSLKRLAKIQIDSTTDEIATIFGATKAARPKPGTTAKKKTRKKVTLDELRKKYGTLTRVTTKDGKTYIGAYQQVGSNVVIVTTSGKKKVPSVNVKKVTPY